MRIFSNENRQPRKALRSGSGLAAWGGGTQGHRPPVTARGCRGLPHETTPWRAEASWHPVGTPCSPSEGTGGDTVVMAGGGQECSLLPSVRRCSATRTQAPSPQPPPPWCPQCREVKAKWGFPKLSASIRMVSRGGPDGRVPQSLRPKSDFEMTKLIGSCSLLPVRPRVGSCRRGHLRGAQLRGLRVPGAGSYRGSKNRAVPTARSGPREHPRGLTNEGLRPE